MGSDVGETLNAPFGRALGRRMDAPGIEDRTDSHDYIPEYLERVWIPRSLLFPHQDRLAWRSFSMGSPALAATPTH